jgi:hypothetical protein
MKFFRYCLLAILLAYGSLAQAHVGSPEVSYQGKAGKYKVLINISPPDVIPGVAIASIYIEGYTDEKVYVQTQYYLAGKKGSVDPEMAIPVNGAKGWFQCSAWLMMFGNCTCYGCRHLGPQNAQAAGYHISYIRHFAGSFNGNHNWRQC